VQFSLTELLGYLHIAFENWAIFIINIPFFSKRIIEHKKIMMLMQGRLLVEELTPPDWQHELACFVFKALFVYAIYGVYYRFYQVVLDFIWVVYNDNSYYYHVFILRS
jgi:hypothetical protein